MFQIAMPTLRPDSSDGLKLLALVRSIHVGRKTGLLELATEGSEKHLFFVVGELYLLASGHSSARKIAKMLRSQVWGDKNSSQTLETLYARIANRLSRWHARSFRFLEGFRAGPQELVGPLPTARILMAAASEEGTLALLRQRLTAPGTQIVAARPTGRSAAFAAGQDETALLSLLQEPTPVDELLETLGGEREERFVEIARLWAVGLIREESEGPSPATAHDLDDSEIGAPRPEKSSNQLEAATTTGDEIGMIWRRHFQLTADPFSLTPDPSFLFISESHGEALAGLKLGLLERRGLIAMTGEVGTGKTTLLYSLLSSLDPRIEAAYIYNTTLSFEEILKSALTDFGVPRTGGSRLHLLEALNDFLARLAAADRTAALVIDEAQNLSDESFEQLRLLLNFETFDRKLLQIVLVGQPELARRLQTPHLRQIADRIAVCCHLDPLSRSEAREYVLHRLQAAGGSPEAFSRRALRLVVRRARGVPRRINVLCHNAMLFAYAAGERRVGRQFVVEALRAPRTPVTEAIRRRLGRNRGNTRALRPGPLKSLSRAVRNAKGAWLGALLLAALVLGGSPGSRQAKSPETESLEGTEAAIPLPQTVDTVQNEATDAPQEPVANTSATGVTTAHLRLRSGPGLDFPALLLLQPGTHVTIIGERRGWLQVAASELDRSGWVSRPFVSELERSDRRDSQEDPVSPR